MDARIEPLLQELRGTRRRTLEMVAPLSQHELDTAPEPGAWSVGEILDHLVKADGVYRDDLAELLRRLDQGLRPEVDRSLSDFDIGLRLIPKALTPLLTIPFAAFNRLAPSSVRRFIARVPVFGVRNAARTTPRAGRPGGLLRAELAASLEETLVLLESRRDELLVDRMRVSYPLIGSKTLPELLLFASDHETRHQGQIVSTLRRTGATPP